MQQRQQTLLCIVGENLSRLRSIIQQDSQVWLDRAQLVFLNFSELAYQRLQTLYIGLWQHKGRRAFTRNCVTQGTTVNVRQTQTQLFSVTEQETAQHLVSVAQI